MKCLLSILCLLATLPCMGARTPRSQAKKDVKEAALFYQKAIELDKAGQPERALDAAMKAVHLAPNNVQYVTGRELVRQELAGKYLRKGDELAGAGDSRAAAIQFRTALAFDHTNSYIVQRLEEITAQQVQATQPPLQLVAAVDPMQVHTGSGKRSFHTRGSTQSLYQQVGQAFGVTVEFDPTLTTRFASFDVDNVDFYTAMNLLGKVTNTFWSPVYGSHVIVANNNQEMHSQYDRMATRMFHVSEAASDADLNDLVNLMRTIFDIHFVSIDRTRNIITVRAPQGQIDALGGVLDDLLQPKPEVMVDIKAYEYDTDNVRQNGILLPNDFEIFNIPAELRRVLGGDAQQVIDQLNKTGTIDPTKISPTALANLQGSPLLSPFLFFGKGLGLTGITVPPVSIKLGDNSSLFKNLEHVMVRSSNGEPALFRVGTRYPIVVSTFTNAAVSVAAARGVIAANGTVPSFQYQDIGLMVKATPHVHNDDQVKLDLQLEIKGLGSQALAGIPIITDREFNGNVTVKDGEPAFITGMVTEQESRSAQGYPGLGQIPGLDQIVNSNNKDHIHNEIVVVVTPHVIRNPGHSKAATLWTVGQ